MILSPLRRSIPWSLRHFVTFHLCLWLLGAASAGAQTSWGRTYGGTTSQDFALALAPTPDGGYVVAGATCEGFSFPPMIRDRAQREGGGTLWPFRLFRGMSPFGTAGSCDVWVLKLDGQGDVVWQKTYGGTGFEGASALAPTPDGGYVVAGATDSFGAGGFDVWVLKLEADGTVQGCPPGLVQDSTASVSSTSVSPSNSSAVVQATSASAVPSSAVVGVSTASVEVVCGGCPLPSAPSLLSPPNGATGVSTTPTLDWSDVTGATSYDVQVCSDSGCTNVVRSQTGLTASQWTVSPALNNGTTYYWRARAVNSCGAGPWSATWSFTTQVTTYTLTVSKNVAQGGTVTSSPAGIDCGTACGTQSASFSAGTVVTLTAAAASGWRFSGWNGCDSVSGNQCTVTMNADRTITAHFTPAGAQISWSRTYGGTGGDRASAIIPTPDGGYVVVGETASFGTGMGDVWVLKLDGQGNVVWQKTYGGTDWDEAFAIAPTSDGGYVVAGWTRSFGAGMGDVWVLKLDGSGNVVWQKTYGGTNEDAAHALAPTSDRGYIVAGWTWSFGAGMGDVWVLKLDGTGNVQWQKTYGGTGVDGASAVAPTSDGGYVVAGLTVSFGAGIEDVWVLKLDGSGNVQWQKTYGGTNSDGASAIAPTSDGGYVVAGGAASFGAGVSDAWVLKLEADGTVRGCPSGFVQDSAASVGSTTMSSLSTSVAGQTTSASVASSSAVVGTSSASSAGVCSGLGDEPVAGDWNGDGKTDAGVVHDWGWGLGWYLDANGNGAWDGCGVDRCFFFGGAGSKPVAGDWNGDGKTDAGVVYDWGWGLGWYLDANGNGAWDGCSVDRCFFFGSSGSALVGHAGFEAAAMGGVFVSGGVDRRWGTGVESGGLSCHPSWAGVGRGHNMGE